uniref:NDUCA1 n=1 Tax=Euglena gracilis TaxID=3039 RepID=UPI002FE4FB68
MAKLTWLKNLLNPYSRVPPSTFLRFFPRLLNKFGSAERDINAEFPGTVHKHIKTYQERFMEQGAGDRIATKWNPKPWEKAYMGQPDHPMTKAEQAKKEDFMVGIHWDRSAGGRWTPNDKFPLFDYEFPIHPGRIILRWLYKQGKEPVNMQRSILVTDDFATPSVYPFGWHAPSAILIGDACISNDAAVFDHCVLRADRAAIWVGPKSHVLEGCTLTTAPPTPDRPALGSVLIGENTVVGAGSSLNACWIGDHCIIGSGCTIGFGARIDDGAVVGAGSVVEDDQYIPAGEVWVGRPARYLRKTGDVDTFTAVAENDTLRSLHLAYSEYETTHGNVWAESDKVCDNLEEEVAHRLQAHDVARAMVSKNFDAKLLKLPKSLVADLMDIVSDDDHPNPKPTVSAQARQHFSSQWDFNRKQEQRPVFTGNYNSPTMSRDMA